jgi:hypothetical protein
MGFSTFMATLQMVSLPLHSPELSVSLPHHHCPFLCKHNCCSGLKRARSHLSVATTIHAGTGTGGPRPPAGDHSALPAAGVACGPAAAQCSGSTWRWSHGSPPSAPPRGPLHAQAGVPTSNVHLAASWPASSSCLQQRLSSGAVQCRRAMARRLGRECSIWFAKRCIEGYNSS